MNSGVRGNEKIGKSKEIKKDSGDGEWHEMRQMPCGRERRPDNARSSAFRRPANGPLLPVQQHQFDDGLMRGSAVSWLETEIAHQYRLCVEHVTACVA